MSVKFDDFLKEQLQDPEIKKEYDDLQPERAIIQALIDARLQTGMTQKELSEKTGIAQGDISKLERGEKCPTIDTLYRLARALGIPIYKLIDIDGDIDNISDTAYKIQKSISDLNPDQQNRVADLIDEIVDLIK